MPKPKLILDIRYFESEEPNEIGYSLPTYIGSVFPFSKSAHATGDRIARKLREQGFITGDFDHLYLTYTTAFEEGKVALAGRPGTWMKWVEYGASPATISSMSGDEKQAWLAETTFEALSLFCDRTPANTGILDSVHRLVRSKGSELMILHKEKDTKTYRVRVSYQIRPNGGKSVVWVEYLDKRNGRCGLKSPLELSSFTDILFLVGSVSVARGSVILKPRQSFKADVHTEGYSTPITVSVNELLAD